MPRKKVVVVPNISTTNVPTKKHLAVTKHFSIQHPCAKMHLAKILRQKRLATTKHFRSHILV